MFTGIIEEVGVIQEIRFLSEGATIKVATSKITDSMKIGDSISVNGVCLTATQVGTNFFQCDISMETLRRSSFARSRQGATVNLERALMVGDRLGGHFVLGHVDDIGKFSRKTPSGEGFEMSFDFPETLARYMVYKGSIAINGISLTISKLEKESLSISVIPHTLESTNLKQMVNGDIVNLEVDILGKYFERFFQLGLSQGEKEASKLTVDYLRSQGY